MKKILSFLIVIIVLMSFNMNVSAKNIIKAGYSIQDIQPIKENVQKSVDSYNTAHNLKHKLNLDSKGHFYLPLQGYGNVHLRKGYVECAYQDDDTGDCVESTNYENPLKVTATAFYDGNKYAIFITFDMVSINEYYIGELRKDIYASIKTINSNNSIISLSATHTHSAPSLIFLSNSSNKENYPDLWWNNYYYRLYVFDQVKKAVKEALSNMYDVEMEYTSIDVTDNQGRRLNFVKHYETSKEKSKYKNGDSVTSGDNHGNYAWDGNKYVGVTRTGHKTDSDTNMQLLKIKYKDEVKKKNNVKDILMINWQAHPSITGGASGKVISADFVGYMRNYLQSKLDYNIIYFTGAAGNLNAKTIMSKSSNEAMIEASYTSSQKYKGYTPQLKISEAKKIGEKLGDYVISGTKKTFNKVEFDKIDFNTEIFRVNYKSKYSPDSIIYNNAIYIKKLYNVDNTTIKKIVEGTYDWSSTKIDFSKIKYDKEGKEIAKLIQSVSGRLISSEAIKVEGPGKNTPSGYTCTINDNEFTLSRKYTLLQIIGVDLDNATTKEIERIYSGYHAIKMISLNDVSNDKMYVDVELGAVSFGNFSFVTAPFELFDTNGINIKQNSIAKMTFILGYTNGSRGYLPSETAHDYGCYEVDNSFYAKGTAEEVQNELISIVKKLSIKTIIGDVNNDGKVNTNDYILVRKHILKLSMLKDDLLKRADVNNDGKISLLDYIEIRRIILGIK